MNRLSRRDVIWNSILATGTIAISGARQTTAEAQPQDNSMSPDQKPKKIGIVLFPKFETLDVFGPIAMWGHLSDYRIVMVSEHGGPVMSSQGVETVTAYSFENAPQFEILMVPRGGGTRTEVDNTVLLDFLRKQDKQTEWTTSVCTGAALLAKAGLLDGRKATTNKRAYVWATSQSSAVHWQRRARWVVDGKYVTSSGVSAGMDMALGLVEKIYGKEAAERKATGSEYVWNDDPENDPFAISEPSEEKRQSK